MIGMSEMIARTIASLPPPSRPRDDMMNMPMTTTRMTAMLSARFCISESSHPPMTVMYSTMRPEKMYTTGVHANQ